MRPLVVGVVGVSVVVALSCSSSSGPGGTPGGADAGSGADAGANADVAGSAGHDNGSGGAATAGSGANSSGEAAGGSAGSDAATKLEPLCSSDGWCWENPLPAGNALYAVSGSSADDVWAVGDKGTILHFDGEAWRAVPSGVLERLTGVWAPSPTEAWVSGTSGALLRWDGEKWSSAQQPQDVGFAFAVTGWVDASQSPPSSTVWFTDGASPIRLRAGQWMREMLPQEELTFVSAWANPAGRLWTAGVGGLARLSPAGWKVFGGGTTRFVSVHGDPAGNVWGVSDDARILRVDAQDVASTFVNDAAQGLTGVHAFGPSNAWAVGGGGALLEFDGAEWKTRPSGTGYDLFALWGASANDVWLVGDRGTLIHCNASACSAPNGPVTADLAGVWTISADEAWAVGSAGAILHRSGDAWATLTSPTKVNLTAVWGSAADDVWFGGSQVLVHWDGGALSVVEGLPKGASALHGTAADDWWAISASSPVHWNGEAFEPSNQVGSSTIFAAGPDDVWVGFFQESLLLGHLDQQGWSKTTAKGCISLSGAGPKDIWCLGGVNFPSGASHWDGAAWTPIYTSAGADLVAVASSGANSMWYVGHAGVLGTCTPQGCTGRDLNGPVATRSFVTDDLTDVASADGDVYAVGRRGVILHRRAKP